MTKLVPIADMDLARLAKRIRDVHKNVTLLEFAELKARDAAAARRLELGRLLSQARGHWPSRGPNAKGWGAFLRSVGIDEDTALVAMKYSGYVDETVSHASPGKLPTLRAAGLRRDALSEPDDPPEPKPERGAWCTPKPIADAVGPWDLDSFSNQRSHIISTERCMLERGDDGFGNGRPGSYRIAGEGLKHADASTRFWGQPDYGFVLRAVKHYAHTSFCFLLRLDPSTEWFDELFLHSSLILIPRGDRIEFDPPPDVEASSNPYPHGLFYAHAKDATEQIRALCYEWRITR